LKFTRIPETAFQKLQLNAGILLSDFDPATGEVTEADLMGATSGGVNFTATPSFSDFGEDIDNCPVNVLELKKLDSWEVKMSGTFITVDTASAKTLIGAADIGTTDTTKIVPRNDILTTDFKDIWWVGDYSDKNGDTNGGFVAIHMLNGLSTGGFQLQSGNREKGQFAFEFTGHYSMEAQDTVPFEVYVKAGTAEGA
jgi:hypothetical protein